MSAQFCSRSGCVILLALAGKIGMTLTTHILIATAVSKPFFAANPALIFVSAVASHYLADAIPHWDWHLNSVEEDLSDKHDHKLILEKRVNIRDLIKISLDITIGSFIAFLILRPELNLKELTPLALSIFGGILPDMLQPIFWLWKKNNPFIFIKHFHSFMHSKILLGRHLWTDKKYITIGKISQTIIALTAICLILL